MTTIGFFNSTVQPKQHVSIYAYQKMADALRNLGYSVKRITPDYNIIEQFSMFDVVIIPQVWYGDMWKSYKELPNIWKEIHDVNGTKIIHFIVNGRKKYFGYHQKFLTENADAIWCTANFLSPFKQPAWYVPSGCWAEPVATLHGSKRLDSNHVLAPLGRGKRDAFRVKALAQYATEHPHLKVHLIGVPSEWRGIELPPNVRFIYFPDASPFGLYRYVLECASSWCMKMLPSTHWSDRVTFAVSFGSQLITNYQPTLDAFKSAIPFSVKEYPEEVNIEHILFDRNRWAWENILKNIMKETLEKIL